MDLSNLNIYKVHWLYDLMITEYMFDPIAYLELEFSSAYDTIFKSLVLCKN